MGKNNVKYKCPFCEGTKTYTRENLVRHVEDKHHDELPEDFTALRYVFNYVNRKPVSYHGICTECKGPTPWDENKGRYDRQCGKKECHDKFVKRFEANMMRTKGVTRISASAVGQEKMLANRRISGTYVFSDGTEKTYTGSYERKALEFMDKVMHIKPDDIMCPGPILEYTFEGKTHIYITDFYYQPYNLIIEVKDGGDRPNTRNMPEYRAKQKAKENYIIKHTNYNYLRLTNNNLEQLLAVFMDLKLQLVENTGERVVHVNEISMSGYMPVIGVNSRGSAYVVNYMQNNAFTGTKINKIALADNIKFDRLVFQGDDGILREGSAKDLMDTTYEVYRVNLSEDAGRIIKNSIGCVVDEGFIYETVFGKKMYTHDQIRVTEGATPVLDYYQSLEFLSEAVDNKYKIVFTEWLSKDDKGIYHFIGDDGENYISRFGFILKATNENVEETDAYRFLSTLQEQIPDTHDLYERRVYRYE